MTYSSRVSRLVTLFGLNRKDAERQVRDADHVEALVEDAAR